MHPLPSGKTNSEGDTENASSRYGTSSAAIGMTSACPPLVVSRSQERVTVKSLLRKSTSAFRNASNSPFRNPV